jgi:hypothetical protein
MNIARDEAWITPTGKYLDREPGEHKLARVLAELGGKAAQIAIVEKTLVSLPISFGAPKHNS